MECSIPGYRLKLFECRLTMKVSNSKLIYHVTHCFMPSLYIQYTYNKVTEHLEQAGIFVILSRQSSADLWLCFFFVMRVLLDRGMDLQLKFKKRQDGD